MLALAHFAIGVTGGIILLILFPQLVAKYFGSLIKNDIFFVIGSGFFAMAPDLNKFFLSLNRLHNSALSNIFWGHHLIDNYPDLPVYALYTLVIMVIALYVYYKRLI